MNLIDFNIRFNDRNDVFYVNKIQNYLQKLKKITLY
jgi:hypothetical protein